MTREIMAQALEGEGLKAGPQGFNIPEEREATCFVSSPGEVLSIGRVIKLDLREKYLTLQTAKEERFVFAYEDVLGLRFSGTTQSAKERAPGFSR